MFSFKLRNLNTVAIGMTQSHLLGLPDGAMVPVASREVSFTTVHMASHEGEFFYTLGTGSINPQLLARVFMHFAIANSVDVSLQKLYDQYRVYHLGVATNTALWRELVAYASGTAHDRALPLEKMGRMPADAIRDKLRDLITKQKLTSGLNNTVAELFLHVESDYAVSQLAELGLIIPGTSFVYRVHRLVALPGVRNYVDTVRASNLAMMFEALALSDMKTVKAHLTAKQAVSPSLIATRITSGAITAHDRVNSAISPENVVHAVLGACYSGLDVTAPDALRPSDRLRASEHFNRLSANLTIFIAAQEMVREFGGVPSTPYSEEQLVNVIFPLFAQALNNVSPYKERTLAEATAHMGHVSHSTYEGAKSHVALFEDYAFEASAVAFTPVRNSRDGTGRFLMRDISVSDNLSGMLTPVAQLFSVKTFVEKHIQAMAMPATEYWDVRNVGTEMLLALPSLASMVYPLGVTPTGMQTALASGDVNDAFGLLVATDGSAEVTEIASQHVARVRQLLRSYYIAATAYAIRLGGSVSVGAIGTNHGENLALIFETTVASSIPLGETAVLAGLLRTLEPMERIAYATDVQPAVAITMSALPLGDYEHALHMWDWHSSSLPLSFENTFETVINRNRLSVALTEVEILALGYERSSMRFSITPSARAIVELWWTWYTSTMLTLSEMADAAGEDSLIAAAIAGRQMATNVALLQRLRAIGESPAGRHVHRLLNSSLANQLRNLKELDAIKQIHVKPHEIRCSVWIGLTLLQLLGLMDETEAKDVEESLSKSGAMTMVMAMSD